MQALVFFVISIVLSFHVLASDHIDGAPTLTNGQADLSDLYAFPTADKDNNLTLILNTYPGVAPSGHFSSKVKYDVEIHQATLNSPESQGFHVFNFDIVTLSCSFSDPGHHHGGSNSSQGTATCQLLKDGQMVSEVSGAVGRVLENDDLKIYTGPRTDAFFLSVAHFQAMTKRKGFPAEDTSAKNGMDTINILSIVAEVKLPSLQASPELIALSAQSLDTQTGAPIDRVGRPEITNLSLHAHDGATPLKRGYNQKPHFAVASSFLETYQQRLIDNISAYDLLDNTQNWQASDLQTMTGLLVNDFLVVNMMGICDPEANNFFAIEKSILTVTETTSCGGRRPVDDVMAVMSGYYIGGINANYEDYRSGVNAPYKGNEKAELSAEFPYLAPAGKTKWMQKQLLKLLIHTQE